MAVLKGKIIALPEAGGLPNLAGGLIFNRKSFSVALMCVRDDLPLSARRTDAVDTPRPLKLSQRARNDITGQDKQVSIDCDYTPAING